MSMLSDTRTPRRTNRQRGFSLLELTIVGFVSLVLLAIALPSLGTMLTAYRSSGDVQKISGEITLARMRAAMDFTQARLFVNLANNSYRVDLWNKAGSCWQSESAITACDVAGTTATKSDVPFANGDAPGFGSVSSAPPSTQTVFGQAPACLDNTGATVANTACIVFNSRGIPVIPGNPLTGVSNTATANDAIYFTSTNGPTFALTVLASGKTSLWSYAGGTWHQKQ